MVSACIEGVADIVFKGNGRRAVGDLGLTSSSLSGQG
jgi:hypothetical protein